MSYSFRLGIAAMTSIFLIASLVAYLAPPQSTGLFAEEHGDCTVIAGGVSSYRYCGPDVSVVHHEIGFRQSRYHVPYIASGNQQYGLFDPAVAAQRHALEASRQQPQPGAIAGEPLDGEPFSRERYASRAHLFDDPYASSPWEKK